MRKIPAKNYVLLGLLFAVTVGIVLFACEIYNSRSTKQYTSVMNSFITEIKVDDLSGYTLENSPVVIYISDKTDSSLEKIEDDYKKLLTDYNLQNYFVYLDVSNSEIDVVKMFEEKYNINLDKDNLPNLVVITEGEVADLYTAKEFIKTEIITFLEKNEVIESD
jgi:hypothetical protein